MFPSQTLELEIMLSLWRSEGGLAPGLGVLGVPLVRHGAVRHQHDGLETSGLPGPGNREIVSHEPGVDLPVIHRAGVHIGRLLYHHLHLLSCESEGQKPCGDILIVIKLSKNWSESPSMMVSNRAMTARTRPHLTPQLPSL